MSPPEPTLWLGFALVRAGLNARMCVEFIEFIEFPSPRARARVGQRKQDAKIFQFFDYRRSRWSRRLRVEFPSPRARVRVARWDSYSG